MLSPHCRNIIDFFGPHALCFNLWGLCFGHFGLHFSLLFYNFWREPRQHQDCGKRHGLHLSAKFLNLNKNINWSSTKTKTIFHTDTWLYQTGGERARSDKISVKLFYWKLVTTFCDVTQCWNSKRKWFWPINDQENCSIYCRTRHDTTNCTYLVDTTRLGGGIQFERTQRGSMVVVYPLCQEFRN